MAGLAMRMPTELAQNATLATPPVADRAPVWAVAHDAVIPHHNGHFEVKGRRAYRDIFRIPNLGGVLRDWLYTRPTMEAIGEDAFDNSAAESTTIFRIEQFDPHQRAVTITPTVSNNWLLVPCQTINGFTVGLTYVDTTYQRDESGLRDNRVPPLRIGRFVIEDATGEIFVTGWTGNIMVIGWIQSMIKCERVRELLLFEAPPSDGIQPRNLLLRNSFYERRHCFLCGSGASITQLPPACSAINKRATAPSPSTSPSSASGPCSSSSSSSSSSASSSSKTSKAVTGPPRLTNVATLYRRFRGSYFGVVLKTKYGRDRMPELQQLVPVFIDVKNGLHAVKTRFRNNLRRNVDFVLDASTTDAYFGVNPRACQRVLMLRASNPVDSFSLPEPLASAGASTAVGGAARCSSSNSPKAAKNQHHEGHQQQQLLLENGYDGRGPINRPRSVERSDSEGASADGNARQQREQSVASCETDVSDPALARQRRRVRVEDSLERDSVLHKRKVRNRESAARSNKQRKMMLDQKKSELEELKQRMPSLIARESALRQENDALRIRVHDLVGADGREVSVATAAIPVPIPVPVAVSTVDDTVELRKDESTLETCEGFDIDVKTTSIAWDTPDFVDFTV